MSYKFIKEPYKSEYTYDAKTLTMEIDQDVSLPQMLEAFQDFLRGCGYHFNGYLDIIEDGATKTEEDCYE